MVALGGGVWIWSRAILVCREREKSAPPRGGGGKGITLGLDFGFGKHSCTNLALAAGGIAVLFGS